LSSIGVLLSEYRKRSHLSQLELALLAEVSTRHISFIETGKSAPSRDMLLKLADSMALSLQDSNLLLNSAGYTAVYGNLEFTSPAMTPVRQALGMMLDRQNPYPALVLDGDWNILMVNEGQRKLGERLAISPDPSRSGNLLELVFDPDGFRPVIENWEEVASHLLRRLRRQLVTFSRPGHVALYENLLNRNPPRNWQTPSTSRSDAPVMTVDLRVEDRVIKLFSTLSQFGTALDVGTADILIENYFPADAASREFFNGAN
jgi:transcriptional regulator with XRE-family HTH domain